LSFSPANAEPIAFMRVHCSGIAVDPAVSLGTRDQRTPKGGGDMNATHPWQAVRQDAAEAGEMKVLIVALDAVVLAEVPNGEALVVAPALNSWLRHWLSDEDTSRRRAEERVAAHLERLERRGVHAHGRVGDADPLLAIADALRTFPADEIVIAASSQSTRLAEELTARARERFALPTSYTAEPLPRAA
jgi:nucleotide-binding universal stress UspA family protein